MAATGGPLVKIQSTPAPRGDKKLKKDRKESDSSGSPLQASLSSSSVNGSSSLHSSPRYLGTGSLIDSKRELLPIGGRNGGGGSELVGKRDRKEKKGRHHHHHHHHNNGKSAEKAIPAQAAFDPSLLQAFLEASFSGDEEMVRCALDAGVPPSSRDDFGSTALHHACFRGHESIVSLLISRRADVEAKDSDGCTPLHNAAFNGQKKCLEALLATKVRVTGGDVDGATALHKAAHNGHLECVQMLIAKGAAVDAADVEGFTALHRAVLANHSELIGPLVAAGANINSPDGEGATPCSTAASEGHVDCLVELLASGCNVDQKDSMGLMAMHVAALNGQSDALALLLNPPPLRTGNSSTPRHTAVEMANLKSADGNSPLHYAAIHGSVAACSVLIKAGADKNAQNGKGSTALHIASARNHAGVVKYLLKRAVDPTVADTHGKTAAQYASTSKVLRYFDKYGMAAFEDGNGSATGSSSKKDKSRSKSTRNADLRTPPAMSTPTSSPATTPSSTPTTSAATTGGAAQANPQVAAVREQGVDGYDALRKRSLRTGLSTYKLDKYGFLKKKEDIDTIITLENALLPSPKTEAAEAVKWGKMISKYRAKRLSEGELKKMREMAEAGIPDAVRGEAWKLLVQSRAVYDRGHVQGVYAELVTRKTKDEEQIQRDIHRTMPEHYLFRDKAGPGQTQLFNVLKAFSVYNTAVGYCQGMGFLVALLLMHLDEEDAFWVLVRLCDPGIYAMDELYASGMPGLKKRCYVLNHLLEAAHPKLHAHITELGVNVTMFVPQWFVTVFLYSLPFPVVLRAFDLFLANGHDTLYYVSLVVFKKQEDLILASKSLEQVLPLLSFDKLDDKQALLIRPQEIVAQTIAYRKKFKDRLDRLKRDADQEGRKLSYYSTKT